MSRNHVRLHRGRWARVRRQVLERDGWRCRACGKAGRLEVDHIVPLEREPGQNPYDATGLQALCRGCHIKKTAEENRRDPAPDEIAWRDYMQELLRA